VRAKQLRQAWRIWICPSIVLYAYAGVLISFFGTLEPLVANDGEVVYYLENMLAFSIVSAMLAVCYLVMIQYERVKQVRVRRRTRFAFAFFTVVYAIYTLLMLSELLKEALKT